MEINQIENLQGGITASQGCGLAIGVLVCFPNPFTGMLAMAACLHGG